ncbi:MAG: histidine kinase, partial [Calditrichaeota bacterium]
KTVLLNIVLNAVHAMPDGGNLRIISDNSPGTITIRDSGYGIPEEDLDNIFDLFYTTKSRGTGLGLPTAYKIVKEHGGEISLNSKPGEGTTVSIYLTREKDSN